MYEFKTIEDVYAALDQFQANFDKNMEKYDKLGTYVHMMGKSKGPLHVNEDTWRSFLYACERQQDNLNAILQSAAAAGIVEPEYSNRLAIAVEAIYIKSKTIEVNHNKKGRKFKTEVRFGSLEGLPDYAKELHKEYYDKYKEVQPGILCYKSQPAEAFETVEKICNLKFDGTDEELKFSSPESIRVLQDAIKESKVHGAGVEVVNPKVGKMVSAYFEAISSSQDILVDFHEISNGLDLGEYEKQSSIALGRVMQLTGENGQKVGSSIEKAYLNAEIVLLIATTEMLMNPTKDAIDSYNDANTNYSKMEVSFRKPQSSIDKAATAVVGFLRPSVANEQEARTWCRERMNIVTELLNRKDNGGLSVTEIIKKNMEIVNYNDKNDNNRDTDNIENKPQNNHVLQHLNHKMKEVYDQCSSTSTPINTNISGPPGNKYM